MAVAIDCAVFLLANETSKEDLTRMKLKKLFAMLMALAMVAGLLAACGNDTGKRSHPPGTASLCPTSQAPDV